MQNKMDEADQDFSCFLKQVRMEANVRLDQLSRDLMTSSNLARIEKGQRLVCKNMRDRLLGRLGVSADLYENMLNHEDFEAWEQQRNILCAIEQGVLQKAQDLINLYDRQEPQAGKDKIKLQFCLVMQAELLKQQKAAPQTIGDCYERAVRLTVPDVDELHIEQRLLSVQEVNMILEYHFYHRGADFAEKCKEMMAYVEHSVYDSLSKAKIYPKIVFYYLREMFCEQNGQDTVTRKDGFKYCCQAIEMLRDTGRAYFLLELLELKIRLMQWLASDAEDFSADIQESTALVNLLQELCAEYKVSAYMQDCTYLYQQRWVFCTGDVLRVRRTMFGLTQQELCGNDCSVRTLRRTERKEANMQYEVLGVLLGKLGLSKEFQRARLLSQDREGLKLMEELVVSRNNREPEHARDILQQMKEKTLDQIPENRQYFMEVEAALDWMAGRITDEELAAREEEALSCTLKVKDLYHMDEVYLTEMEMLCIQKRIRALPDAEKRECIDFLLRFFDGYEKRNALSDYISMYEFAAIGLVCELGNLKEYQRSTDLAEKVLRESLKCKRIWGIEGYLYEISWNAGHEMTECLKKCIILSHFCKRLFYEDFYDRKLHQS